MTAEHSTSRSSGVMGVVVGLVISSLLSAALVISAAKAGITPGVSPLVVLVGWMVFGVALGPKLKRFLAMLQVTGSAGTAVTAGVVFTAPLLQVLTREQGLPVPAVDVSLLIVSSLAGCFLGFGFVGLATKRFLTDPRLPAPEAVACDRLIQTAVANPARRPPLLPSLAFGLLSGFLIQVLTQLHWLKEEVGSLSFGQSHGEGGGVEVDLPLPVSPLYLGIGGLLTLPTALLIFTGGLVNAITIGVASSKGLPSTTFRWVGGATMVVAVLYSLLSYMMEGRRRKAAREGQVETSPDEQEGLDESLLNQTTGVQNLLKASIAGGFLLFAASMFMGGASVSTVAIMLSVAFVLVWLLSDLGGLLSLQVGSSASPVSGTVFMGMLVLSMTALGVGLEGVAGVGFLVPILVAVCVAICASNDSSQDYKTLQLNGFTVSDGFKGQLAGLLAGAIVVPLTLWVAHEAYGLGTEALPSPQASFYATVLQTLFLQGQVPMGPVMVGIGLGFVAIAVEILGKRRGLILSSLAFAVGIYLPSVISTGMALGALARFWGTRSVGGSSHRGILISAGLITGDAMAALLLGILIIAGVEYAGWGPGEAGGWSNTIGLSILVLLLVMMRFNYARRGSTEEGMG